MESLAISLVFALGLDVEAVLPSSTACTLKAERTAIEAAEWKRMYAIAGGWAIERQLIESRMHADFWQAALRLRMAGDMEHRGYAARELRRMMGWTK